MLPELDGSVVASKIGLVLGQASLSELPDHPDINPGLSRALRRAHR
jgi:hypothetical protein